MTDLAHKTMAQLRLGITMMPRNTPPRIDWNRRAAELLAEFMINEAREGEGRSPSTTCTPPTNH